MQWIVASTRRTATHVFLSEGMKDQFEAAYGSSRSLVSTNARYVRAQVEAPLPEAARARMRIGHLSNLCREKGFFDAADTFVRVVDMGLDAEFCVAGPVIEAGVSDRLRELEEAYPDRIKAYGYLNGVAKDEFYRSIDVFLFPTRFAQEAAPNVVYEALAAGTPVIANRRGCIADMLSQQCGLVVDDPEQFAEEAARQICSLDNSPEEKADRQTKIRARLKLEVSESVQQFAILLEALTRRGGQV